MIEVNVPRLLLWIGNQGSSVLDDEMCRHITADATTYQVWPFS